MPEGALECDQLRNIVFAAQHERARPAEKAHGAIEGHFERRGRDCRRSISRTGDEVRRKTGMGAKAEQRHVKPFGGEDASVQPMADAELLRRPGQLRRRVLVRE